MLLVEDDRDVAEYLRRDLEDEGYAVTVCYDGAEGLRAAERAAYDILVLDVMLPFLDGFEVTRRLRRQSVRTPILLLTARDAPEDVVRGLDAGADDYLTKPFHLEEFLLRIKRMLDRYEWYKSGDLLKIGDTRLDFSTLEITGPDGAVSRITPHEANLIQYLVSHQGRIVTRSELLKNVWGLDPDIETRTVDTFISRIRRYFEKDSSAPEHIVSIRGKGYRFMP